DLHVGAPGHRRAARAGVGERERRLHVHHRADAVALDRELCELRLALLDLLHVDLHLQAAEAERDLHVRGPVPVVVHDDRHWTANVKIPLGLGGLKMKVDMEKIEEREPEFAKLAVKGNGVGAMMNMETSFTLSDSGTGGTAMAWSADVKI